MLGEAGGMDGGTRLLEGWAVCEPMVRVYAYQLAGIVGGRGRDCAPEGKMGAGVRLGGKAQRSGGGGVQTGVDGSTEAVGGSAA